MKWSDIPRNPDRHTLRQFAALWLVILGLLACWHGFVSGRTTLAIILAVLACSIGPLGIIWPRLVRPVFVGALIATFPIGWLVSHLLLACFFGVVFIPLGLWFRLRKRDVLELHRPDRATYWVPKEMPTDLKAYFRQC